MDSVFTAFSESGGYMQVVLVAGLAIWFPIAAQIRLRRKTDFSPLLWGVLVVLFLIGILCDVSAIIETFMRLSTVAADGRSVEISRGISIVLNTTALTAMVGIPAALGVGAATVVTEKSMKPAG